MGSTGSSIVTLRAAVALATRDGLLRASAYGLADMKTGAKVQAMTMIDLLTKPALVQAALNRVYNQFYRHQLVYQHATMNCASISIDVLRAVGWDVRSRGPTSAMKSA